MLTPTWQFNIKEIRIQLCLYIEQQALEAAKDISMEPQEKFTQREPEQFVKPRLSRQVKPPPQRKRNELSDIVTDRRLLRTIREWNQQQQILRQAEVDEILRKNL